MAKIKLFIKSNIIVALAVVFVTYHLVATVLGIISFSRLLFWTSEEIVVESSQENATSNTSIDDRMTEVVYGYNVEQNQWPSRIVISSAQINIAVVGRPRDQGAWDTSSALASFDTNSALPNGKAGNTIIFGHSDSGPFQSLEQLSVHDEILVQTDQADYTYSVTGFSSVSGYKESTYAQSPEPILTLIAAPSWESDQKLIVTAGLKQVNKKE